MTFEQFVASRHEGIANYYYAGGMLCIEKPSVEGGAHYALLGNVGVSGDLETCERGLFDALGHEYEWSADLTKQFSPEHYVAGRGTMDGMTNVLNDYCAFHGLEPLSADEMIHETEDKAHRQWLQQFIEYWYDIEELV
jgi:hypothetical protein